MESTTFSPLSRASKKGHTGLYHQLKVKKAKKAQFPRASRQGEPKSEAGLNEQ